MTSGEAVVLVPCGYGGAGSGGTEAWEGFVEAAATGREWWVRATMAEGGTAVVHAEITDAATALPIATPAVTALLDAIAATRPRGLSVAEFRAELAHAAETTPIEASQLPLSTSQSSAPASASSVTAMGLASLAALLADIEAVGETRLRGISGRCVALCAVDARNREHVLRATLPNTYPQSPATAECDLPAGYAAIAPARLPALFAAFVRAVDALQPLFDELDNIDARLCTLPPASQASTARRIALGAERNVTLQLDIDPQNPRTVPAYWLLGPAVASVPLKGRLDAYRPLWNPRLPVVDNLCAAFGGDAEKLLLLPRRNAEMAAADSGDCVTLVDASVCGICYAIELDGALPRHACDNPRCGRVFHEACLYEWLRSAAAAAPTADTMLSSSQGMSSPQHPTVAAATAFNGTGILGIVFGACPFCSARMSAVAPATRLVL